MQKAAGTERTNFNWSALRFSADLETGHRPRSSPGTAFNPLIRKSPTAPPRRRPYPAPAVRPRQCLRDIRAASSVKNMSNALLCVCHWAFQNEVIGG
ncbi:MAG: hypothetical protein Q8M11_24045 [Sulfuritalea sp.]|nr:hypothetical protein [Sulfuritalea sp.]MDP1983939.1 hypothetical protein [Sulfuritalea sp.]